MTSLLLALRLIGWLGSLYPSAAKNWATHKASFLASVVFMYLALVEERVIVTCCFD